MKIGDREWEEMRSQAGKALSIAQLMEMAQGALVATAAERQEAGKGLLLEAAAQTEDLHSYLRQVVESLAE